MVLGRRTERTDQRVCRVGTIARFFMNAIKTVVVTDDEIEIVDLLRRFLEREDYRVVIAQTGLEAIRQVEERHPDLLLLDVMLPELTGIEVCKQLRAHPHTRHIPIIMVSAKPDEADVIPGLELGADDYVTKPFSPRAVLSRFTNPPASRTRTPT